MISFLKKTLFIIVVCFTSNVYSQSRIPNTKSQTYFELSRGNNVITTSFGTAVMNGDFLDPLFDFYGQIGYKRFVIPHLNVNFTYNKFNLVYKDLFNNGFMSFDINVEGLLFPDQPFSPFVYAGAGLNASNYFKQSDMKSQIGFGVEYIAMQKIGIKLFADYSQVYSDLVDGRAYGDSDDAYWRIAVGLNFYFGNSKKKPITGRSIINSNPIIHNN